MKTNTQNVDAANRVAQRKNKNSDQELSKKTFSIKKPSLLEMILDLPKAQGVSTILVFLFELLQNLYFRNIQISEEVHGELFFFRPA